MLNVGVLVEYCVYAGAYGRRRASEAKRGMWMLMSATSSSVQAPSVQGLARLRRGAARHGNARSRVAYAAARALLWRRRCVRRKLGLDVHAGAVGWADIAIAIAITIATGVHGRGNMGGGGTPAAAAAAVLGGGLCTEREEVGRMGLNS